MFVFWFAESIIMSKNSGKETRDFTSRARSRMQISVLTPDTLFFLKLKANILRELQFSMARVDGKHYEYVKQLLLLLLLFSFFFFFFFGGGL